MTALGRLPFESSEASFDLDQLVQNDDVRFLGIDTDRTRLAADYVRDVSVDIGGDVDLHVRLPWSPK